MLVHPEESTMPRLLSRSRNVPTHFPGNPSNSRPGSGSLNFILLLGPVGPGSSPEKNFCNTSVASADNKIFLVSSSSIADIARYAVQNQILIIGIFCHRYIDAVFSIHEQGTHIVCSEPVFEPV
jgi:hypothetical protein